MCEEVVLREDAIFGDFWVASQDGSRGLTEGFRAGGFTPPLLDHTLRSLANMGIPYKDCVMPIYATLCLQAYC